jgi:hypothetical protein
MAVVISCEVFGQRNGNKVEAVAPDFWPVATGKTFSASKEKKNRSMPSEGRLGQTPTGREVIGRSSRGCSCFRSVNPHPVLAFLSWVYDLVAEPPARYSAPRPAISVPDRFIDGHEHHLCAPTRKTAGLVAKFREHGMRKGTKPRRLATPISVCWCAWA